MVKNIKMGRISLPMDVSSSDAVPAFENMLTKGPMAVVLVYADWCGHCDQYKKNVWSPLKSTKNRTVNMVSLRDDMVPNTSLKNAKIDGYPSILVVGKDKKPAVFKSTSGVTNALPEGNDVSTMRSLITAPVPNEVTAVNASTNAASVPTNLKNAYTVSNNSRKINTGVNISYPSLKTSKQKNSLLAANSMPMNSMPMNSMASNSMASNSMASNSMPMNNTAADAENTYTNFNTSDTPTARNTEPPSIDEDELILSPVASPRVTPVNNQGTTPILRGGRLLRKLSMKRKAKKSSKRRSKKIV
jgi:thiol-disulfide isomerase/thioredoxin